MTSRSRQPGLRDSDEDPAAVPTARPSASQSAKGLAVFLLFSAVALAAYWPALGGAFLSDDEHYVAGNRYVQELSLANLAELVDPRSPHSTLINNYAPVHAFLYAVQWQLFGANPVGYHVVNVLFHALAATLLVGFLIRTGIAEAPAVAAGAVFVLHPANVEAVAWISQLKSPLALALALGALWAHPRRPVLAWSLFVLALFAKPSALFALPVAGAITWLDRGSDRRDWAWLAAWVAAAIVFSILSLLIFADASTGLTPLYADPWDRLRTSGTIGMRYLVMAASGYGLSTFHEPAPARSWFDPWWLGSLVALVAIAWRATSVARARRRETLYWIWAAAAYAPVSGVLSLPFPMADRYLYFVLPGLLGALLLAGQDAARGLAPRVAAAGIDAARGGARSRAVLAVVLLGVLVAFGAQAHQRSRVWRSGFHMMADAERHYPEGMAARTRQATRAARAGRVDEAVAALRAANERGYVRLSQILAEPAYQPYLADPRFRGLLREIAKQVIDHTRAIGERSQESLRTMAYAHYVRGEFEQAIALLEEALVIGDLQDDLIEGDLAAVRREQRLAGEGRSR